MEEMKEGVDLAGRYDADCGGQARGWHFDSDRCGGKSAFSWKHQYSASEFGKKEQYSKSKFSTKYQHSKSAFSNKYQYSTSAFSKKY